MQFLFKAWHKQKLILLKIVTHVVATAFNFLTHLSLQQGGSHSCQSSPEVPSPWQQNSLPTSPIGYQGNNNNLNYLPCSSQCDNSRNQNLDSRFSVQAYAVRHGLNEQDFHGYDPDLKDSENPHYYHINSILYNAHLEKAKRYGTEYVYKGT